MKKKKNIKDLEQYREVRIEADKQENEEKEGFPKDVNFKKFLGCGG